MSSKDDAEPQITTDRETIREWGDRADAVPVRYAGADRGSGDYAILSESERTGEHEQMEWNEFFDAIERDDEVVMFYGTGSDRPFEVVERDKVIAQSRHENEIIEQSLMEGETVTTEVTETTVVEETFVQHADIESELIDRQHVEELFLDAELTSREVLDCTVTDVGGERMEYDGAMFETGHETTGSLDLEMTVDVQETWSVTKELIEQVSVESRVVDTDVEASTEVESDTIESHVELDEVERTIVESGILASEDVDVDAIDRKSIQSEYASDEAIVTELMERKTVDEELSVRRRLGGAVSEAKTTEVETLHREVIESEMAEADEYEVGDVESHERSGATTGTTGAETVDTTGVEQTDTAGAEPTDAGRADTTDTAGAETADASGTGERPTGGGEAIRMTPEKQDKGKTVVDTTGEEIGMVADVREGTLYVDPHPSVTEKIKAALDWGEMDEESYPVEHDQIAEITYQEVRIRGDE